MKSVVVIGAGACGITAMKSCMDEGLQVTCFERTNDIGKQQFRIFIIIESIFQCCSMKFRKKIKNVFRSVKKITLGHHYRSQGPIYGFN